MAGSRERAKVLAQSALDLAATAGKLPACMKEKNHKQKNRLMNHNREHEITLHKKVRNVKKSAITVKQVFSSCVDQQHQLFR